jgi:hypothetical protein
VRAWQIPQLEPGSWTLQMLPIAAAGEEQIAAGSHILLTSHAP